MSYKQMIFRQGHALASTLGILMLLVFASAQPAAMRAIGVDSSITSIPLGNVLSGGPPPQGIPALGFTGDHNGAAGPSSAPSFIAQAEASWLVDEEPVILMTLGGESRIYPLQILTWHEIANDTLGGVPIAVTFCPLCNSALSFDRRIPLSEEAVTALGDAVASGLTDLPQDFLDAYTRQFRSPPEVSQGLEVTLGVSGMLYKSNMLMFDTDTSTLWSQLLGDGVVGTLTGTTLLRYPAPIVSFAEARAAFPEALVLSRDTGYSRNYGRNPYVGYDRADSPPFLYDGVTDGRLPPKARVVTFELAGEAVAYPFSELEPVSIVNDKVGGEAIAVFWQAGTTSALDQSSIAQSEDVGAVNVFSRQLGDRLLSFSWNGEAFIDEETGSSWNILGQATSGELLGSSLTAIVHDNTLWFAWASFKPETRIFEAP